jgi:hypothetical protein
LAPRGPNGLLPASPPVVSFNIVGPAEPAPERTVIDVAPPEPLPCGLKELPPGADPDEWEWVEINDYVDTKMAEEE